MAHDAARQDTALRLEQTSMTVDTTPNVVARQKLTHQLHMFYYVELDVARTMTGPCGTNGQVEFRV